MFASNPFARVTEFLSPLGMKAYVVLMKTGEWRMSKLPVHHVV